MVCEAYLRNRGITALHETGSLRFRPRCFYRPVAHEPKGAEKIAACWADAREVPRVAFKPDWTRHAKAARFKHNDQTFSVMPVGVIIFPGRGI